MFIYIVGINKKFLEILGTRINVIMYDIFITSKREREIDKVGLCVFCALGSSIYGPSALKSLNPQLRS